MPIKFDAEIFETLGYSTMIPGEKFWEICPNAQSSNDLILSPGIQNLKKETCVCFTSQFHSAELNVCLILGITTFGFEGSGWSGATDESPWVNLLSRAPSSMIMHHRVIFRQVLPCHSSALAIWLLEYLERNRNVWLTLLIAWQNKLRKGTLKHELGLVRKWLIPSYLTTA